MAAARSARKRNRPLGVTLLALWEILVGIQLVLFGFGALSYSDTLLEGSAAKALVFFIGLGSLIIGISDLLLARGYILGRESARRRGRTVSLLAILLAVLGVVVLPAKLEPESPFLTIVMNVAVFLYLGSDGVVAYFRSRSR